MVKRRVYVSKGRTECPFITVMNYPNDNGKRLSVAFLDFLSEKDKVVTYRMRELGGDKIMQKGKLAPSALIPIVAAVPLNTMIELDVPVDCYKSWVSSTEFEVVYF